MHVSNSIKPELLAHLFKMVADGAIVEDDVKAFVQNPQRWRENHMFIPVETAHIFWQGVWDELLGKGTVQVPPIKRVTKNQKKTLARYGFLLMYLPFRTEKKYPACFVKPDWSGVHVDQVTKRHWEDLDETQPKGKWIAVETLHKPNRAERGTVSDRLMATLGIASRFGGIASRFEFGSESGWSKLHQHEEDVDEWHIEKGLLQKAAEVLGFPCYLLRCPDTLEWNLLGNLFNWLRERRSMNHLPDLGSTDSWEMVRIYGYDSSKYYIAGSSELGGLAGVSYDSRLYDCWSVTFRILIEIC